MNYARLVKSNAKATCKITVIRLTHNFRYTLTLVLPHLAPRVACHETVSRGLDLISSSCDSSPVPPSAAPWSMSP